MPGWYLSAHRGTTPQLHDAVCKEEAQSWAAPARGVRRKNGGITLQDLEHQAVEVVVLGEHFY